MKIRLKFSKEGPVKFVGHLDIVRLFQRALKVARIPVAYSQGFSPHSLVYFAMPLPVGMSSLGEYMDIITSEDIDPLTVKENLNAILVDGIKITDAFEVSKELDSLMSLVGAADYSIQLAKKDFADLNKEFLAEKLQQETLEVEKKGKKGIKLVDIKPLIRCCEVIDANDSIIIELAVLAGSSQNLSPDLFLKAILPEYDRACYFDMTRRELYTEDQGSYIALDQYGR